MMPPGVHDANPSSPNAIAANECIVTPSTSLPGTIASKAARSSMWSGTGCCKRIPCTVGSCDRFEMTATSSSVVVVVGSETSRDSMPAFSLRLRFIRT